MSNSGPQAKRELAPLLQVAEIEIPPSERPPLAPALVVMIQRQAEELQATMPVWIGSMGAKSLESVRMN